MSTATDVVSVEELEAHFELEVPCGGNSFPHDRPCPAQAGAILVSSHNCGNRIPEDFKCLDCYMEWLRAILVQYDGRCRCTACKTLMIADKVYRPL